MKLYSFDNKFIREAPHVPDNFTGILDWGESKEWWFEGKWHRLDGPAVEYSDGTKFWYIDNKCINCNTNEEFKLLVDIMKLKGLL